MSIDTLVQQVLNYSPETDPQFLLSVYAYSREWLEGKKLNSGIPYIQHALGTAMLLTRLQMGQEAVAAALLHDVPLLTSVKKCGAAKKFW